MINYAEKLKSTNSGGLANADDIAYEVTTGVDGDGESMETGFTSVKEAIDGLKQQIQDGIDVVDEQQILSYATRAETAAATTQQLQENVSNAITQVRADINNTEARLDNLDTIARSLSASLSTTAQIVVISKTEYDALQDKKGLLYYIYDENNAVEVDQGKTIYSFTSWNADGSIQYGSGTVITTGNYVNNKTEILVVTNTEESWVGRTFLVLNNAVTDGQTLVSLYDENQELVSGVAVKIVKVKDV